MEAVALMGHLRSRSQRDCNLRPYDPTSAPQLEREHAGTHQVIARAAHAHETHTEYWRRRGGRWVRVERSALAGASARQGEHGRARLDGAGAKTRDFLTTIVRSQIPHEVWPTTNMEYKAYSLRILGLVNEALMDTREGGTSLSPAMTKHSSGSRGSGS